MRKTTQIAGFIVTLVIASAITASAQPPRAGATGADLEAAARKVVLQCAGITEGEIVLVSGSVRDIEFLENIAVNVRAQGAFPLLTVYSNRLNHRMYADVPARYDSQTPDLDLKLARIITAAIDVSGSDSLSLMADVSLERMAARGKAYAPVTDLSLKLGTKKVSVGNGLYPTAAVARQYAVSQPELAKQFWNGVNTDYARLAAIGKTVKAMLAAGKEVHITSPNGTDLRLRVEGRPVFVSDGVVSAEDAQAGGAAATVWLPAGEVFLAPVKGTAEGKVVFDHYFVRGSEITGLTLEFKGGVLTSMTAKSGLEPLKQMYDVAGAGRDQFAMIDIGINPDVTMVPGSKLLSYVQAGMITVGLGGNTWAGGDNAVPFGMDGFIPGCTLTVDGKALVEKGKLTI
jgi:leucyl aminopeptidase (aminopeptidase T)